MNDRPTQYYDYPSTVAHSTFPWIPATFYQRAALALRWSLGGFSPPPPPPGKILEIVADRGQRDMGT